MQNSLFVQGGSQPIATGKQPVGVLSNSNYCFVGFVGFVIIICLTGYTPIQQSRMWEGWFAR